MSPKKLLFVIVSHQFSFILCVERCAYDGQLRLARKIENLPFEGVSGVIEICVNGTFTRVCANNSFSSVDTETLSRLTCSQLGYSSEGRVVINPSA